MTASNPAANTHPAPAVPGRRNSDWRESAACRRVAAETFFPAAETGASHDNQVAAAKAVCRGCAVLTECREWALLHLPYGVAGGLTETERSTIRRLQRRTNRTAELSGIGPTWDVAPTATPRERRTAAVRCVDEGRASRDQAARQFHVSTRTIDRWLAAARASA